MKIYAKSVIAELNKTLIYVLLEFLNETFEIRMEDMIESLGNQWKEEKGIT